MKESIAFWYEPASGSRGENRKVELHFNLWRDLLIANSNFFDVGIKFFATEDDKQCRSFSSFSLFIPGRFHKSQCIDLGPLMRDVRTLNAVFNDVVSIDSGSATSFDVSVGTTEKLTIHQIVVSDDVEIEHINLDDGRTGTVFTFPNTICLRLSNLANHYLRLRFKLDAASRELFFSDSEPSEWFLLPSFARTELTEFRWNERRSFPPAISQRNLQYFHTTAIHYFLVRDIKFELISAHTNFHKIRRLEDQLWQRYLHGELASKNQDWRVTRALSEGKAREMIIYHWRVRSPRRETPIDDFIAFAKFRFPIPNLLIYAIAIVCLGGAGNAIFGLISPFVMWASPFHDQSASTPGAAETVAAGIILLLLAWILPLLTNQLVKSATWLADSFWEAFYFLKRKLGWLSNLLDG